MALIVAKTGAVIAASVGSGAVVAVFAEGSMTAGEILLIISGVSAAIVTIIGSIATAVVMVRNAKKQTEDEVALKKAYAGIANEAIAAYAANENLHRMKAGKPLVELPAAVIAEGSSPPKPIQQEAAALATMRAHMALLKLQTGQPPRREPNGHSDADVAAAPLVEVLDTIKTDATALAEKAEQAKTLASGAPAAPTTAPPVAALEPPAVEQKTVEQMGEQISKEVLKATEKKVIKEVRTAKDAIIEHLDKDNPDAAAR